MNRMVNYIRLAWKLACMLWTYRTCNSTVEFSKYEFNNKLLGGVTLLRTITGISLSLSLSLSLSIYIYIYIYIYIKDGPLLHYKLIALVIVNSPHKKKKKQEKEKDDDI